MDYQALKVRFGSDPHALAVGLNELGLDPQEQLHVLLAAFDDRPSYGVLMYVKLLYSDAPAAVGNEFLSAYRTYLVGPDERKAHEVLYSLWCDFFEDSEKVEPIWRSLVGPGSAPILLKRVLPCAGPVPWPLKRQLLNDLAAHPSWHPVVFQCLLRSQFDAFGKIEPNEARRLLARLKLPTETPDLGRLQEALGAYRRDG